MKIVTRLVFLAVLGGLGFWLWIILFPSPEKAVLKKIASLAATATFSTDASNLTRAGKVNRVVGMFTSDAQIILNASSPGGHTFSGSDEIRAAALGGFGSLPSLKVEFLDATAKVSPAPETSAQPTRAASTGTLSQLSAVIRELESRVPAWLSAPSVASCGMDAISCCASSVVALRTTDCGWLDEDEAALATAGVMPGRPDKRRSLSDLGTVV